jgi:hypothetical protein
MPLLVVGIVLLVRTVRFVTSAHQADARVTKVDQHGSVSKDRTTRTYRPTFEFLDAGGTSRTVTLDHYSSTYNYTVGRRVKVLYLPDDPHRLRVASFFGVWGVTLIVGGLGVWFCMFGGLMWF